MKVAIIGGGPIGMAAAAHFAEQRIAFEIFEAGDSVGHNILSWGHVQLFSPWKYNMDNAAKRLLSKTDWVAPTLDRLHTGSEFVERYLNPLSHHPDIQPYINLNTNVIAISKVGLDKMKTSNREQVSFELKIEKEGNLAITQADVVLDATGTWNQPNPLGSSGLMAEGEIDAFQSITRGIPDVKGKDSKKFVDQTILVVGSGHSAINTLLDLADLQETNLKTKLHWVLRKKNLTKVYGGQEQDGFEARGKLGIKLQNLVESKRLTIHTPFYIHKIFNSGSGLSIQGFRNQIEEKIEGINHIISNTGSRPNLDMIKELRVDLDSSLEAVFDLAPLIDPNVHSCGTVRPHGEKELRHPEKNFYIIGSKSYGRAPTFLLATGYEQVRSIVAYLSGDFEGALRTELELPETGVCSTNFDDEEACCTPTSTETTKTTCC
jgi:thioredoxin reductase